VNETPSSERLLQLLREAREAVAESEQHWGSIQHLTRDRKNRRRHAEALAVLDALIRYAEATTRDWARDRQA
jgi:hypothetical protein